METRDLTDLSDEMQKSLEELVDLIATGAKPTELAGRFADVLDRMGVTKWARELREARYDGDRVNKVMDDFLAEYGERPAA